MTCLPAGHAGFTVCTFTGAHHRSKRATRQIPTSRDGAVESETCLCRLPLCNTSSRRPPLHIFKPVRLNTLSFTRGPPTTSAGRLDHQSVSFTHPDRGLPADVNLPCVRQTIHCGLSVLFAPLLHPDIASKSTLFATFKTVRRTRPPLREGVRLYDANNNKVRYLR